MLEVERGRGRKPKANSPEGESHGGLFPSAVTDESKGMLQLSWLAARVAERKGDTMMSCNKLISRKDMITSVFNCRMKMDFDVAGFRFCNVLIS